MATTTTDLFSRWGQIGTRPGASMTIAPNTGRQARFQEQMDVINRRTGQRGTDIRGGAQRRSEAISAKLGRIGMGNTTVGTSLQAGVTRDMEAELRREADAQQGARLGVLGQRTGFIEAEDARREAAKQSAETARLQAEAQLKATKISIKPAMAQERARAAILTRGGIGGLWGPGGPRGG